MYINTVSLPNVSQYADISIYFCIFNTYAFFYYLLCNVFKAVSLKIILYMCVRVRTCTCVRMCVCT